MWSGVGSGLSALILIFEFQTQIGTINIIIPLIVYVILISILFLLLDFTSCQCFIHAHLPDNPVSSAQNHATHENPTCCRVTSAPGCARVWCWRLTPTAFLSPLSCFSLSLSFSVCLAVSQVSVSLSVCLHRSNFSFLLRCKATLDWD